MSKQEVDRDQRVQRITDAAAAFGEAARSVDEAAAVVLRVNPTDLRLIGLLHERGPMSAGQLAEASGLSLGAMTTAISRLVSGGHASRTVDTQDRRRVVVALEPATAATIEAIYGGLASAGRRLLQAYSDRQLELLETFLRGGQELQLEAAARAKTRHTSRPA